MIQYFFYSYAEKILSNNSILRNKIIEVIDKKKNTLLKPLEVL